MTNKKSTLMKSMTVIGLSSLIFLTGCGSNSPAPSAESASPSVSATESAAPSAQPTSIPVEIDPAITAGMTPEQIENYKAEVAKFNAMTPEEREKFAQEQNDPFGYRLVAGSHEVAAGSSLRVTGGTYEPGTSIQVYGAQQMAMPSYDAANDMYHQVGDEVKLTEVLTVVANDKGQFDIQLPIPSGTAPQLLNIVSIHSGGGDLVQTTVK